MTKIFISQPMKDKTNQEIEQERNYIIEKSKTYFGEIEVIDSFFKDAQHDVKPLWFLGKSLELLSTADVVVFAKNWENSRGCRIEHECAVQYGIKIVYFN